MKSLVLFSNDLRLNDNDAINSSIKGYDATTFLFIFDKILYTNTHGSANLWWLEKSLQDLKNRLLKKNITLQIIEGDFVKKTLEIVEKYDFKSVFINQNKHPEFIKKEDTLSFELSLFGKRVIVNSGTSVYGNSEERQLQRGTISHSTVMVDSENSSEIWGAFRVARRAKVFNSKDANHGDIITLSASHNGYHRLNGKPTHSREWEFSNDFLVVYDLISGKGSHEIDVVFPLHPEVKVFNINEDMAQNFPPLNIAGYSYNPNSDVNSLTSSGFNNAKPPQI